MEQSIKFRILADELTEKEFNLFSSNLLKLHGRQFLISALFAYFIQHNNEMVNKITSAVSNIIKSRKDKKSSLLKCERIDKLPSALIGHTASFLPMDEYINFEKCNRCIYYGCNAPNKLKKMDGKLKYSYPWQHIVRKYNKINHLPIDLIDFNEDFVPDLKLNWTLNNIGTLILSNVGADDDTVDEFIDSNRIKLDNIQRIGIGNFGSPQSNFSKNSFCRILPKISNVEYLDLYRIYLTEHDGFSTDEMLKWFPNLRGFSTSKVDLQLSAQIIHTKSNQLESLHLFGENNINTNTKYPKLKEIKLYECADAASSILDNTSSLKRVILSIKNDESLMKLIDKVIDTQNELEYLCISLSDEQNVTFMIQQIGISLHKAQNDNINNKKKNEFMIKIHLKKWSDDFLNNQCGESVYRLIHILEAYAKDFVFCLLNHPKKEIMIDYNSPNMKLWSNSLEEMRKNHSLYIKTAATQYILRVCDRNSNQIITANWIMKSVPRRDWY